jgi:hypothetical protein
MCGVLPRGQSPRTLLCKLKSGGLPRGKPGGDLCDASVCDNLHCWWWCLRRMEYATTCTGRGMNGCVCVPCCSTYLLQGTCATCSDMRAQKVWAALLNVATLLRDVAPC